jgi:hypothetical protein
MARHGCGGGTASAMDAIRNDAPRTSRSAVMAYFARMEVVVWQQGGGNKGNDNGEDVITLAVTRAGIGCCNESGWGEVEDMVIPAAGMSLCGGQVVDGATKGGGWTTQGIFVGMKKTTMTCGSGGRGEGAIACVLLEEESSHSKEEIVWPAPAMPAISFPRPEKRGGWDLHCPVCHLCC